MALLADISTGDDLDGITEETEDSMALLADTSTGDNVDGINDETEDSMALLADTSTGDNVEGINDETEDSLAEPYAALIAVNSTEDDHDYFFTEQAQDSVALLAD